MAIFSAITTSVCTKHPILLGPALISDGFEDADQSCSHCGDKPINLAPLQREVSGDERTARVFVWPLTRADGTANKRLV